MRIWVAIFLIVTSSSFADFRVSHVGWNSQDGVIFKSDKFEHCLASSVIYGITRQKHDPLESLFITTGLSVAWEIKDGFIPFEKYGRLGGEGFCIRDVFASFVGSFAMFLIDIMRR